MEEWHERWRHGRSQCGRFHGVPPRVRCVLETVYEQNEHQPTIFHDLDDRETPKVQWMERNDVLDTVRVEIGLIDTHGFEGGRVEVVLLLLEHLLTSEITGKGTGRSGAFRIRFLGRDSDHCVGVELPDMCSVPSVFQLDRVGGRCRTRVPVPENSVPGRPTYPEAVQ